MDADIICHAVNKSFLQEYKSIFIPKGKLSYSFLVFQIKVKIYNYDTDDPWDFFLQN